MTQSIWDRYREFLRAPPQQVFEWYDPPTGARGWLVINSLRGGAAGGGTRMRTGVTREEVTYLAKAMELKFAFSGPPIGGAKSGIAFDPSDPRRAEVLERWFRVVRPFLTSYYGTGGDVNVDEQFDVVPLCSALGIRHPQEGVVRGHLNPPDAEVAATLGRINQGVHASAEAAELSCSGPRKSVADLVTGYGVCRALVHLHELRGEPLAGKRVVVEGFGNVGAAAALFLARAGVRIVGLVDRDSALLAPDGLDAGDIENLLCVQRDRLIPDHPSRVCGDARLRAYELAADIFVPAAISGSVGPERLTQLARAGVRTIVCGANQPFRESSLGDTTTQEAADRTFEVIPDVIGSLGMARAFHFCMTGAAPRRGEEVFDAVARSVEAGVDAVVRRTEGHRHGLMEAAVGLALEQVGF